MISSQKLWRGALVATALSALGITMCGGSGAVPCTAGQSIACAGIAGCSGFQVCKSDGTYDVCDCGNGSDAGLDVNLLADSTTDSAQNDVQNDVAPESGTESGTWTSPASFTGLSLWLETSVGVVQDAQKPGYVRRWLDQSGNSNDADVENYTQCEPTIDPSVLNGHDAIAMFASNCDFHVLDATSLQFGTADFLVGFVVKVPSYSTNALTLWTKTNNGDPGLVIYQDTANNFTMDIVGTNVVVADPNTGKFHIVIMQGANLKVYVDALSASGPTNTTDISAVPWGINLMTGNNFTAAGYEVAEIVAVKGTVSGADVTNLQNYWKQKFKL